MREVKRCAAGTRLSCVIGSIVTEENRLFWQAGSRRTVACPAKSLFFLCQGASGKTIGGSS